MDILGAHGAVDDEVDGAVDDEGEMLDGGQGEHPARVDWQHTQFPAQVGPSGHARSVKRQIDSWNLADDKYEDN